MADIIICAASIAVSYLLGSIPFALIIGKYHGIDIRKVGSCNVGATNVTRSVGKGAGRLCFVCDFAKGALPVFCCEYLLRYFYPIPLWLPVAAGMAAILGHVFPIFLKFKGGKGISTAAGMIFAIAPYPLLAALATWVIVFKISGYVSLGSIVAAALLPFFALGFAVAGIGGALACNRFMLIMFFAIAFLAVWRHRSNISRLINGTESSFKKPKNPQS